MKTYLAAFFVLALIAPPTPTQGQSPPLETEHTYRPLPNPDLVRGAPDGTIVLWSGSLLKDIAPELSVFLEIEDLASEVDQRAESIRLAYQADRNYDLARLRLGALWVRAMRQDGFTAAALRRVFLLRFQLALDAGDWRSFNRVDGPGAFSALYFSFVDDPQRVFIDGGAGIREEFERSAAMIALREQGREKRGGTAPEPRTAGEAAIHEYIEEHFGTAGPELRELAVQALFTNDIVRMRAMGPKAAGVVAATVLAQLQGPADEDLWDPDGQRQSFKMLLQIDQPKALRLFVDWFDVASTTWRGQVYSGCRRILLKWLPTPPGDPYRERVGSKLWDPTWLELVEKFVSEPTLRIAAMGEVAGLAKMDGLDQRLSERLGSYLRTGDRPLAGAVLGEFDAGGRVLSAVPALVEGTRSEILDIRQAAGWKLVEWGAFPEARALASDPDPELRVAAATAMGRLKVTLYTVGGAGVRTEEMWARIELEDLHRIEALLEDPVEKVREVMARVLDRDLDAMGSKPMYLTPGTLEAWIHSPRPELRRLGLLRIPGDDSVESKAWIRELMSDPDPEVRRAMVNRWGASYLWTEEQVILVLRSAVADADEEVRAAADGFLGSGNSALKRFDEARVFAAVLPVRQAVNPTPPLVLAGRRATWAEFAEAWDIDPRQDAALLEFGIDFGLVDLVEQQLWLLIRTTPEEPIGNVQIGSLRVKTRLYRQADPTYVLGPVRTLSLERRLALRMLPLGLYSTPGGIGPAAFSSIGELLQRAIVSPTPDLELIEAALEREPARVPWLLRPLSTLRSTGGLGALKRRVFLDPAYDLEVCAAAGHGLDIEHLAGGMGRFWALFDEVGTEDPDRLRAVARLAGSLEIANRLVVEALTRLLDDERAGRFASLAFRNDKPGARSTAIELLMRLLPAEGLSDEASECINDALDAFVGATIDEAVEDLVIQASQTLEYPGTAIEVMRSAPSERFMQALFELIDRGSAGTASWAANALGDYASDAAFVGLRERLPEASSEVRDAIIESLQRMHDTRVLLAGFESSALPDSTQATAELVELLDAELPAARAAAARGLGRFGAPEALPRLIRMLTTEQDPKVLAALDAAIEMLISDAIR